MYVSLDKWDQCGTSGISRILGKLFAVFVWGPLRNLINAFQFLTFNSLPRRAVCHMHQPQNMFPSPPLNQPRQTRCAALQKSRNFSEPHSYYCRRRHEASFHRTFYAKFQLPFTSKAINRGPCSISSRRFSVDFGATLSLFGLRQCLCKFSLPVMPSGRLWSRGRNDR